MSKVPSGDWIVGVDIGGTNLNVGVVSLDGGLPIAVRSERTEEWKDRLPLLRTYHNTYAPDEFVAFLGFPNEESLTEIRQVGDLLLEEYLFTGLRDPMGMSYLAAFNQFVCTPLVFPRTDGIGNDHED